MSLLFVFITVSFVSAIEISIEGHESQSVNSLTKALNVIENIRSQSAQTPISINVNGGIHEPITLNSQHSNIQFIGNIQNSTIINGGYMITSKWSNNNNNNIWSTSIDLPSNYSIPKTVFNFPKQFWINNQRRTKLQTDILFYESTLNPSDKTAEINKYGFVYKQGDIKSSWNLFAPGVYVAVFAQWTVSLHQVKYHNPNNRTIIFEQPSSAPIGQYSAASQKRYYIVGVPELALLPNSGRWNAMFDDINNATKIIINYAAFNNETFPPLNTNEIFIEHPWIYKPVVSLSDVSNVVFDGFQIKYSSFLCPNIPTPCDGYNAAFIGNTIIPGAVYLQNTKDITIKNSIVSHIGSYSIWIQKGFNTQIVYNNLSDFGTGGVFFTGSSDSTLISDNYIFNGGFIIPQGSGIGGSSQNVTVQYNEINKLVGAGMNIYSSPYLVINKNYVHHNGRSDNYGISDFGAIYLSFPNNPYGTAMMTNNKIHDIISYVYGGNGIYLDYGSSNIDVYGNLVYNVGGYTLIHSYNYGEPEYPPVIVRNNIFITSGPGSNKCDNSFIIPNSDFNKGLAWNTQPPKLDNASFINNINYIVKQDGYCLFTQYANESWFTRSIFDYNVYYTANYSNNHMVYFPGKKNQEKNMIDFTQWKSDTKQDIHSKLEDPKFVNVEQCNFELQKDSPVFKDINFKPLNVSDVGPRLDAS